MEHTHVDQSRLDNNIFGVYSISKKKLTIPFALLGNAAKASEILAELDKGVPGIIIVKLRRINLERRRGNFDAVAALYEEAIVETSDQELATFFAIRYARFLAKVGHNATFFFI